MDKKYQPVTVPQSAAIQGMAEDDLRLKLYQPANDLQSSSALCFGKNINNSIHGESAKTSIMNITNVMDSMPQPKAKKGKKKKKKDDDDGDKPADGEPSPKKAKKKKKGKPVELPPPAQWLPTQPMSVQEQMSQAANWSSFNKIQ